MLRRNVLQSEILRRGAKGGGKKGARYFGGYARGPCRAIKLRNGGSPLDVWRELHSLVKASRNSRRYRHRRGYINVSSYVLTAYLSPRPFFNLFSFSRSYNTFALPLHTLVVWYVYTHLHPRLDTYDATLPFPRVHNVIRRIYSTWRM